MFRSACGLWVRARCGSAVWQALNAKGGVMRVLRSKKVLLLVVALVAAGIGAAIAIAAVTSQRVITDTGNVHLRVQKTVADGYDSGWHVHPGLAVVQVQEGSI